MTPVPVTVTLALAFDVDPPGAYCTPIVQLAPGARFVVAVHWVPVAGATIENVPPAPPTFVSDGVAANENAVAVAAFMTVMTPVLVVVSAVPALHPPVPVVLLHNAGTGPEIVRPAVTVNEVVAVPPAVVTVTVRAPTVALPEIVNDVVSEVPAAFTVVPPTATPVPETVTAAPVRLVPVMVTGLTLAPCGPEPGVMPFTVGGSGAVTVNEVLAAPDVVTTVTVCAPKVAVVAIVKVVVSEVPAGLTVVPLTVIPPPAGVLTVAPFRLVPVMVTETLAPCGPEGGVMPVTVGGAAVTMNVGAPVALVVPAESVTVTVVDPNAPVVEILKVATT